MTLLSPSISRSRRDMPIEDLTSNIVAHIKSGGRLGLLTARSNGGNPCLVSLILHPGRGAAELWETPLAADRLSFPSITRESPQAHWFERSVHDLFGIRPVGHPRSKSLILHEAWPEGFFPLAADAPDLVPNGPPRQYEFLTVAGDGVYEIPVGPIHAGIIEPGHFRFSCLGEVIQNLEIRLGYQHRGIERKLTKVPWRQAHFLAEAASSDTTVGNAVAHALAIEQIANIEVGQAATSCRAIGLEIERIASHIGDLGGLSADIGYAAGASIFGQLRGRALGLGERLTGSRFMTNYFVPGGVSRIPDDEARATMQEHVRILTRDFSGAAQLIEDNAGVLERMEGIGIVKPSQAADFGLVGPAGRASGVDYDVRRDFHQHPYDCLKWTVPVYRSGDVLARTRVRIREVEQSLRILQSLMDRPLDANETADRLPGTLPADAVGLGMVEAWRGELIHLVFTDADGLMSRYAIKDPSFNNWTGLAVAARGQLVADFPVCNKSFGLSYSGNDL